MFVRFLLFFFLPLICSAERVVIAQFDFGSNVDVVVTAPEAGHRKVGRVYSSPRFLWTGPVMDAEMEGEADPVLRSGVTGERGEFRMGLADGLYRVTLTMADRNRAHGPFSVLAQGAVAASGVSVAAGEVKRVGFEARASGGVLRIGFEAGAGRSFVVNGLKLEGPAGARLERMFADAPEDVLPSREELLRDGRDDARGALKRVCEWLLQHRRPNGFLGDWGSYGTSRAPQYYWYTAAYPIRALLAGYDIFGDVRYRAATESILDRLVEEQLPNGAFQQVYRGKPTAELTAAEVEEILTRRWINTADVGSIVTALAVAARYVEEPRRTAYTRAARRYCDEFAMQWQKASGGFTNGLINGKAETNIYSVATGTQAAQFAAVYAITGEEKYRKVAERAAAFLADNISEDGRPLAYPFSPKKPVVPYLEPLTHLGEIFYHQEGMLFAYAQSTDEAFREKLRNAYRRQVMGSEGLMNVIGGRTWWPLQDSWNNSKSAGMAMVMLAYARMTGDERVAEFVAGARRFLSTEAYSRRIGMMVEDPELEWGGHSLQSWTGCTVAATGFGGMSLAEMVKPGVVWGR